MAVDDEFRRVWKEEAVTCFKVLSKYSPEGSGDKHENTQPGWSYPCN
jgi:hypothetical protein